MAPLCIACDFDGTITRRDTLHVIVEHFGDPALWDALEPDLRRGDITVEQALQSEFDTVRTTLADVLAVVREHAPVRDGFGAFVDWATANGHEIFVCSNGFRSVIDPVLAAAGVDLPVVANDASFGPDGATIAWEERGGRCTLCDRPCKRDPMRRRAAGRPLVLIGDGISDRCGAGCADVVFARAGLAEDLAAAGRSFLPFEDFYDVRAAMARLEVAA